MDGESLCYCLSVMLPSAPSPCHCLGRAMVATWT